MNPTRNDNYHEASSVEELTAQNVKTIKELEQVAKNQVSRSDRVASAITAFCGSMKFVWVHVVWFMAWIILNTRTPWKIDPYPFNFLTLVVSLEAIFLSTFIMISENRQSRVDERRSQLDLQINLLAEQENTKALELLGKIALRLGIDPHDNPDLFVLEQATRPESLVEQIDAGMKEELRKESTSDPARNKTG